MGGRNVERCGERSFESFSEYTGGAVDDVRSASIFRRAMNTDTEPLSSSFNRTAVAAE